MLRSGKGGPMDLKEARKLYRLAAEQGIVEAKYNLAVMLQDGEGAPVDVKGAARQFESAARGGVTISFLHLATLSTLGDTVDLVEAFKWARLAEEAKVDGAAGYIEVLAPLLSAEQHELAETRVRGWK